MTQLRTSERRHKRPRLVGVFFNPEHWNANCACTIPESWEAHIDTGDKFTGIVQIAGDTKEQAFELARAEFPNLKGGDA